MKVTSLLFSFLLFLTTSFTISTNVNADIKLSIKGIGHDLKEGLKPAEFGELTIESSNKNIKIEAFQITLARGNRAIEISDVKGNKFDLRKYDGYARSGDRIVIEIKKVSDPTFSQQALSVWAIRII